MIHKIGGLDFSRVRKDDKDLIEFTVYDDYEGCSTTRLTMSEVKELLDELERFL
jgi:hypothetical protein